MAAVGRRRWATDITGWGRTPAADLDRRRVAHRPDDVGIVGERRCRHSRTRRILGPMATRTPRARAPRVAAAEPIEPTDGKNGKSTARARAARRDPDGGHGEIHDQLVAAVAETARLLEADGAMVYLLDPETGHLRFAHDAGIRSARSRVWVRTIRLPIGTGMFGNAVARREVVHTDDYLADPAFDHAPDPDRVVEDIGIRSMVAAPLVHGDEVFGALGAFSTRPSAFSPSQIALVRALADHAAAAMANARLIEQLARSQSDLAATADAERTLREIAARVSAMRDQEEILQSVIDAAARLLEASGVTIDLIDGEGMAEAWPDPEVSAMTKANLDLIVNIEVDPNVGVSGMAIANRTAAWTGDYLADERFTHTPDRDAFVRESGIQSVIAAPLIHREEVLGVVNAYSDRIDAFDAKDAGLLAALADQAAVTIANARLIEELEVSREEIARRADAERTLREIAARVSAILDPAEVLQRIVEEAARLLDSDGARIDQYDPEIDALRWSYSAGEAMSIVPEWAKTGGLKPGQAVAGLAFAEQRAILTRDYLDDDRFEQTEEIDAFVRQMGIRAVISTPLSSEAGPIGTISVVSRSPGAYDGSDLEVLTALATQASIAIRNARLMEELERSRADIERRAEAEHALREIAARITAIREPGDLLQRIVDEALRLLRADGAVIDEFDPIEGVLVSAYDAGLTEAQRVSVRSTRLRLGEGLSGRAMAEGRVITAGDYLAADFVHVGETDELAATTGIGDLIVAPIIGDEGPLGAIEVYRHERHAFDPIDEAVLGGLADQAAIAITNARLIEELERSRRAVALRAETERSLRDITARIAALREPDVILERVVEEAKRLLGTDGAHLTRMSEDGTYLIPVVVAGGADAKTRAWLLGMEFPLGGGINGLAAEQRVPVSTIDYQADPRIPQEPDDVDVAIRLGLRGMAAAPLRAPGGEVIGTLAVSSAQPRDFLAEELDLLQGLADQAAIAITNTNLLTRLTESEERYRFLIENAPDLIWSVGADARLTFLSDAVERMTGHRPEELLGQHFGVLVHESSRDVAELDWSAGMAADSQELRGRVNLVGPGGEPVPAEFIAIARLDEDGSFAGANGSVRDMRERDRLERDLRESEERYRFLVENSPDVVFATDADGQFTFISEAIETMTGYHPSETVDRHFSMLVQPETLPIAADRWEKLVADPTTQQVAELTLTGKDGRLTPVEVHAIGIVGPDGGFAGIHGATRDIGERERLQRELRGSEERYRYLVSASPDLVWVTDADGRLTFISEVAEAMLGRTAAELIGRQYWEVFAPEVRREVEVRFKWLSRHPTSVQRSRLPFRHADGHDVLVEINGIGMLEGDRFVGAHGAARDVSDRERLEGNLRRQAGELAAGEERAHLARELHDSVTQALFSMTLVSRSVELLLDRDVDAARTQLTQLRELQREALAEMRALIFELRPGNLEQDGLTRALKTHTAALQGRIGLPVVVESTLGEERLALAVEETLYRIAQEALHNVVKHAAARQVRVEVGRRREGVRLRIEDDGKGFDPSHVPAGHLGLAGMQARASRIGATFVCRSVSGKGTTVEVVVPDAIAVAVGAEPDMHRDPAPDPSIRDR